VDRELSMSFHVAASDSISEEAMEGMRATNRNRTPFRRWPKGQLHALADGAEMTACGQPTEGLFEFRERSWPPRGISPDSSVCHTCTAAVAAENST
jgi:hypothetical protein